MVTATVRLLFTADDPVGFLDLLWTNLPAHPGGPLLGAVHVRGDRGRVVVRVSGSSGTEFVVLPGQVLQVGDPSNSDTWTVVDGPAPPRLNLPS